MRLKRSLLNNNRKTFLSAITGSLPRGKEELHFYDCLNKWNIPNTPIFSLIEEHKEDKDKEVIGSPQQNNLDETYDFFRKVYGRKSFDGKSKAVNMYYTYGEDYCNAFFDGLDLYFGKGDNYYFLDFSLDITVVAHECGHEITQYESNLIYEYQSGAINEHASDVYATMVDQYIQGQTVSMSDWLIGRHLWNQNKFPGCFALRSMKAPGTAYSNPKIGQDDQPAHMDKFYKGHDDEGGVHINSGILNKAFHDFSISLGEHALVWDIPGKIWYYTLADQRMIKEDETFTEFAQATLQKAKQLYGKKESITVSKGYTIKPDDLFNKLKQAWINVGIS